METPDPKRAEDMLASMRWFKSARHNCIYTAISRPRLITLLERFGLSRRSVPKPGYMIDFHKQNDVRFNLVNKAGSFEINIYGDVSSVIPAIAQKAKPSP